MRLKHPSQAFSFCPHAYWMSENLLKAASGCVGAKTKHGRLVIEMFVRNTLKYNSKLTLKRDRRRAENGNRKSFCTFNYLYIYHGDGDGEGWNINLGGGGFRDEWRIKGRPMTWREGGRGGSRRLGRFVFVFFSKIVWGRVRRRRGRPGCRSH